jgi:hypothetical protein
MIPLTAVVNKLDVTGIDGLLGSTFMSPKSLGLQDTIAVAIRAANNDILKFFFIYNFFLS